MAYVLGLPTIKENSQEIISTRCDSGFIPIGGVAVSLLVGGVESIIIPFNGEFYGFAVEYNKNTKIATVITSGLGVPVRAANGVNMTHMKNIFINPQGYVDLVGVEVNGFNELIDINAIDANTGLMADNALTVSFGTGRVITDIAPPALNDFNQQDFLAGDFA